MNVNKQLDTSNKLAMKTKPLINFAIKPTALALAVSAAFSFSAFTWAQQSTSYTYDSNGKVLTEDGSRTDVSDVTTYTYDANGNRTSITNALGQLTQLLDYDARGQVGRIIDANGIETLLSYHARGWLESVTLVDPSNNTALNSTTQYQYDAVGQLIGITLPNGTQLSYTYDGARRLTQISNSLGERIDYTLDNAGNRTQEQIHDASNTLVYSTTQAYDELSRVMDIIDAEGQTTHLDYDVNSNNTAVTNPRIYTTNQAYDPLDRLTQTTDANGGITQFAYDAQDRLTTVTDANGNTTTYTYDAFDNIVQVDSPDTGITTYQYDNANNRTQMIDARGVEANYRYDALNRLTEVNYPASPSEDITYTYDDTAGNNYGVGRLTQISDGGGTTSYQYDHRGNLLQKSQTVNGQTLVTAYTYDLANNLTELSYPNGLVVHYGYDSQGRVSGINYQQPSETEQPLISNISYLPFGPISQMDYGNGLSAQMSYDQNYRIIAMATGSVINYSYSYDANGNIITLDHLQQPSANQQFSYDPLDRLSNSSGDYGTLDYTYDPVGNRLSRDQVQGSDTRSDSYNYILGSNQLSDIDQNHNGTNTQRSYLLDESGNPTSTEEGSNIQQAVYNHANRLAQITVNGTTASYEYNALGQRVSKTHYQETTTRHQLSYDFSSSPTGPYQQQTGNQGLITIEAENYHRQANGSAWQATTYPDNSGTGAMTIPNGTSPSAYSYVNLSSPRLDYEINFVETGTYYVWVRGWGATYSDDSIHIGLDGTQYESSDRISGFTNSNDLLEWNQRTADSAVATIEVTTTGLHVLNAWPRENGMVFDKVVITRDASYNPGSSAGPVETAKSNGASSVYTVSSSITNWDDLAQALYGTSAVASQLQAVVTGAGYNLALGASIPQSVFPLSLDEQQSTDFPLNTASFTGGVTGAGEYIQTTGGSGLLAIEAENYHRQVNGSEWQATTYTGNSGTGVMTIPNGTSPSAYAYVDLNSPRLDYDIQFTETGTYYVWVRGWGADYSDDSIHIGLDGTQYETSDRISGFTNSNSELEWNTNTMDSTVATIEVTSTGIHTLNAWPRENGLLFDKVVITRDSSYTPGSGAGPVETARADGAYYTVSANATWESLAQNLYGSAAVASSLSTVLTAANYSLTDGEQIPAGAFPATLTEVQTLARSLDSTAFTGTQSTGEYQQVAGTEGLITIEAENYHRQANGTQWQLSSYAGQSGTGVMTVPNGTTPSYYSYVNLDAPRLDYDIYFAEAGTYYVWVRGWGESYTDDSIHIGLDGTQYETSDRISGFTNSNSELEWNRNTMDSAVATIEVSTPGIHTLNAWPRENGMLFDKVVLTRDSNFSPTADTPAGPGENTRGSEPASYTVNSDNTWADLSQAFYGTTELAEELQSALALQGYTLAANTSILARHIPLSLAETTEVSTTFVYNEAGQLLGEYDAQGSLIKNYLWLNGQPVAQVDNSGLYFVHTDHLGTPKALTDSNQATVWAASYTPFGEAVVSTETVVNNLRFPGQYEDGETGFYYNYFRYYDPALGRYITPDPRGALLDFSDPQRQVAMELGVDQTKELIKGNLNHIYNYVDANPLLNIDPTGEGWLSGLLSGAIVGLATWIVVDCIERCADHEECENDPGNTKALAKCSNFCIKYLDFLGWNSRGGLVGKIAK